MGQVPSPNAQGVAGMAKADYRMKMAFESVLNKGRESLQREIQPEGAVCRRWADLLCPEGRWPDLDYSGVIIQGPAGSYHHLKRIRGMGLRLVSGEMHWQEAIQCALTFWIGTAPQSKNWFHNEIGSPSDMRDIILLLGPDPGDVPDGAFSFLRQYRVGGTGANLVWSADIALHDGAWQGDEALVERMALLISEEIKVGDLEGIQNDWSFFQHGFRLQQLSYGFAFLSTAARAAWQLQGTPWQLEAEKVDALSRLLLAGTRWMLRGRHTVPSTVDRQVARPGMLGPIDLSVAASHLAEIDPRNAEQLQRIACGEGFSIPEGHRHFPVADFTAYHRPEFSFFLKTTSDRTERAETINGENLGGAAMMGQGDAYLMRSGVEYFDMMPCWDWNLLPGTTFVPNSRERVRNAFTGGVSDGISGLTVMDYEFGSPRLGLKCRKFWAAHGDRIVCLIGGVSAPGNDDPGLLLAGGTHPYGLFTALDQTRQCGEVTVGFEDGSQDTGKSSEFSGVSWIHHNQFAYILLQPSRIQLRLGEVSGSWAKISLSGSSDFVRIKRFLPVLRHGTENVAYVLAPAKTPREASQIAREAGVAVLHNDPAIQSVRFTDGMTMTAVYQPDRQDQSSPLKVNQSCLFLQTDRSLFLSNPAQNKKTVRITHPDFQSASVPLPSNGSTVRLELKPAE